MSCDIVVAMVINHLPKRIVENINPCKLPRTLVRTVPGAPQFMRNFRGKKKKKGCFPLFFFHGKRARESCFCALMVQPSPFPLESARRLQSREAVTLADREVSCDNKLQNTLGHGRVRDFMNILHSDSESPMHFLGPRGNSELSAHSFGSCSSACLDLGLLSDRSGICH